MVATTVTPPSALPPPDLPPLPGVPQALPDYLRRFSLWCRTSFTDRFGLQSSTPHVYMTSLGGRVFKFSVNDAGLLLSTAITPGTGKETTPVITFSPITTTNIETRSRVGSQATSGSAYHMVGLAITFTPQGEYQAIAVAVGGISNTVTNGETDVVVCFGTGTPPTTGAALAGTMIGSPAAFVAPTAGASGSFSASGVGAPLVAASYWFDIAIRGIGGAGAISNYSLTVSGLP
jgi:hypothetical protein